MVMVSKEKTRVIVSIKKENLALLDKIVNWYNYDGRRDVPTRSYVIDNLIEVYSEELGIK